MSGPEQTHIPVLLAPVVEIINNHGATRILDCTFGGGGYSRAFLTIPDTLVYALDRDPAAAARAEELERQYPTRFHFAHTCFGDMDNAFKEAPLFDAIVFDYGVSSYQLDEAERGFSFRYDGPLDMRMSGEGQTAADIVNTFAADDLAQIIYTYGGERQSRAIAAAIVAARKEKPFTRTLELAEVVRRIVKRKDGLDPATLTFQALRIFVNNELIEVDTALRKSLALLKPGGVVVCVSFHELEDRIVKHCFKESTLVDGCKTYCWSPLNRKVIAPTQAEVAANPRARSARLRAALKVEVGKRA